VAGDRATGSGIHDRDGIGDASVDEFSAAAGLPVLLRIPFERAIAEGIAQGRTLVDIHPEYASHFRAMYQQIAGQVKQQAGRYGGRLWREEQPAGSCFSARARCL